MSRIFKLITTYVILATMTGCSSVPYSNRDKVAFGALVGTAGADWHTTNRAIGRGGREMNPLLDDKPSSEQVALLKAGQVGLAYLLGEVWPDKREGIFYTCSVINGVVSVSNSRVGQ